jgi:hypothetical protein
LEPRVTRDQQIASQHTALRDLRGQGARLFCGQRQRRRHLAKPDPASPGNRHRRRETLLRRCALQCHRALRRLEIGPFPARRIEPHDFSAGKRFERAVAAQHESITGQRGEW